MTGGFSKFVGAAQQGRFSVDTNSAREMIMSIAQMREQLDVRLKQIAYLKTQAMLGDLPEAWAIAELDARVASGDQQSLEFVLQRFAEALDEAHQALKIGMGNYAEVEEQAEQGFWRIGEG